MDAEKRIGKIRVLPPETARKIAAGEVVDRPAALVRELIDNAVDARAMVIEVAVSGGGTRLVEVVDDGQGMERDDLELCRLPHATSKIAHEDDLLTVETLGFRGEALSSISAVARLVIESSAGAGAWRLSVGPGERGTAAPRVEPTRRGRGTTVRVSGLFDSFPARKKFLKRDAAEAALCRQALIDKALAFPEVTFRFIQEGELRLFLPAVISRKERFGAALDLGSEASFLHEIFAEGPGFSLSIVVGDPELARNDRRLQFIVANGRRIQDFGLQQALEYGTQGWFPNGTHPVGGIFLDVDPALADFNIHPAKREARFKDPQALHRAATTAIRDFLRRKGIADGERNEAPPNAERGFWPAGSTWPAWTADRGAGTVGASAGREAMEALLDRPPDFVPLPGRSGESTDFGPPVAGARFLGTVFGLFLVVERGDRLYLIDQHAAHERILYERLRARAPVRQELLVPYPFSVDSEEEEAFLETRRAELGALGIGIEQDSGGTWILTSMPEAWRESEADTVREILDLRKAGADLAEPWLAVMACRAAAKDGDFLDRETASKLAEAALALAVPRCPHGRPIWMEIRREDLLRAVRRTN